MSRKNQGYGVNVNNSVNYNQNQLRPTNHIHHSNNRHNNSNSNYQNQRNNFTNHSRTHNASSRGNSKKSLNSNQLSSNDFLKFHTPPKPPQAPFASARPKKIGRSEYEELSKDEIQFRNRHDTAKRALKKYQVAPPTEMLNTHNHMSLGFPGFYPNTLEQPEEKTTVDGIKQGWADALLVPHEESSFKKEAAAFFSPNILSQLNKMIVNTLHNQRKIANIPDWARPEIRSRPMTETQKDQWLVSIVARSNFSKYDLFVPSDIKTVKVLDYLIEHLVPMKKSLWVIRLIGLANIQNSNIPPSKHTHDWTSNFTQYLQSRISQLLNPTINTTRTPDQASVLRQQWDYCVDLSKALYVDNILDQKIFLKWVMDSIMKVSSNYVACLLPIAIALLGEFACTRALSRLLIPVLLSHIEMIENTENPTQHQQTLKIFCQTMLQSLFCTQPGFFFHVKPWQQNESKYFSYMTRFDPMQNSVLIRYNLQVPSDSFREKLFSSISHRNSRLVSHHSTESNLQQAYKVSDQILEELFNGPISLSKEFSEISSFYFRTDSTVELKNKIRRFCFTCLHNTHHNDMYLFYLIPSIVRAWKDSSESPQEQITRVNIIHEALFAFLEESLLDECSFDRHYVLYLFSQFIRENVFDLGWYIKKLIACGEIGVWNSNSSRSSKHSFYLRSFPGYHLSETDKLIRKTKAYSGEKELLSTEQQKIDQTIKLIKSELEIIFSDSFNGMTQPIVQSFTSESSKPSEALINHEALTTSSPYCASEVSMILNDKTRNFVVKNIEVGVDNWKVMARPGTSLLNLHQFSTIANILETLKEIGMLIELCIWLLSNTFEKDLEAFLIVLFNRYRQYFISMNIANKVVAAMVQKYDQYKPKGIIYKPILSFLHDLQKMGFEFEDTVKIMINSDLHQVLEMASSLKSFNRGRWSGPNQLPELYTLTNDPSTISSIADSLVYRYNDNPAWWSQVLLSSAEVISSQSNNLPPGQLLYLMRAHTSLLWELSLHTFPEGFILEWVEFICESNKGDQTANSMSQWCLVLVALLAARGACRLEKILQKIFTKLSSLVKSFLPTEFVQISPNDVKIFENLHFFIKLLLVHHSSDPLGSINLVLEDQELYALSVLRDWAFQNIESLELPLSILMYCIIIQEKLDQSNPISLLYKNLSNDIIQAPWFLEICHQYPNQIDKKFTFGGFKPLIEREQIQINSKISSAFSGLISTIFGVPNVKAKDMLGQITSLISLSKVSTTSAASSDNLIFRAVSCLKEYFSSIIIQLNEKSSKNQEFEKFTESFFDEWIVDDSFTTQFLTQIAREMPQECVSGFLDKGLQKLNCPTIKTFPDNVMIYSNLSFIKRIETLAKFQCVMAALFQRKTSAGNSDEVLFVAAKQFSEQLGRFLDHSKIIEIMQTTNCSFKTASKALNASDKQINKALKWIHHYCQDSQPTHDPFALQDENDVNINTLRGCALIRFQLQASVLPHLLSQTQYPRCEEALENMMLLLLNPLVHCNGTQDQFFTHILDSVCLVLDEVSNKNKSNLFSLLRNIQRDMVLPVCVASRIKSLFPFESRNTFTPFMDPPSTHNKINLWEWGEMLTVSNPPENLNHFKAQLLPLTKSTSVYAPSNSRNIPSQGMLLNRNQFLSPPAIPQPPRPVNAHNRPPNYPQVPFHQPQMHNANRGHHGGPMNVRPLSYNAAHTIKSWMHTTDPASLQLVKDIHGRSFTPARIPNANGGNNPHGDRNDHPHSAAKNPTPSDSTQVVNVNGGYGKSTSMAKGVSKR